MEDYYVRSSSEIRFRDLRLVFCGREACRPLHCFGPVVRPTYIIHYILKGKGVFRTDDETWHLHEKEGFLIEPEKLTFYQADKDDPWTYCWIGFDGSLAPHLVHELGLGEHRLTFCCDQKEQLEEVFTTIFENQLVSELNDLVLESQLYRFFAILMKSLQVDESRNRKEGNNHIRNAIRYIRNNYYLPIHVSDVADQIGINRSYMYTLFVSETGMSPNEYLVSFRLTRAAEMLKLTVFSVEQIAVSCGYQDSMVFSKAFRKKYGLSPLQYRKKEEENLQGHHFPAAGKGEI